MKNIFEFDRDRENSIFISKDDNEFGVLHMCIQKSGHRIIHLLLAYSNRLVKDILVFAEDSFVKSGCQKSPKIEDLDKIWCS